MKTIEEIMSFEALYESHLKSQKGVIWKDSVARFSLHGFEEILKLSNQLKNGDYKPQAPVSFSVTRPKPRDILAISYRDRVWQRTINDNILYPRMSASFIKENCACQFGKGIDFCLDLFKKQMRRFYINHGADGYILQIDVKKYYPSMRHDVVKEMFRKKLNPDIYEVVARILDEQYHGDVGYNPGSQMVQIAGISLLDGLDHFIKEKLHVKDYIRMMDDMVLIHEDKKYLEFCLDEITKELAKLYLEPHDKKTHITTLKNGIEFVGFQWRLTDSGKVLQFPRSQSVRNYKYYLRKLMKMYANGLRTKRCVDDSKNSRLTYMKKGNNHQLIKRLEKWYDERMDYYEQQREDFLSTQNSLTEGTSGNDESESGECRTSPDHQRSNCCSN